MRWALYQDAILHIPAQFLIPILPPRLADIFIPKERVMAFRSIGVHTLTKLRLREHGDFNPLRRPLLTECSYLLNKVKALGLGEALRNHRERIHIGALSVKGILCHRTVDIDADELSSQNASEFHLKPAQKLGEFFILFQNVTAHACPSLGVGRHSVIPCPF